MLVIYPRIRMTGGYEWRLRLARSFLGGQTFSCRSSRGHAGVLTSHSSLMGI